jgi:hypothetical protein
MVKNLLKLWRRLFPVYEERTVKIAMAAYYKACKPGDQTFRICNQLPNIYMTSKDPCWYISAPWGDVLDGTVLRSSRVIVVSKVTGAVLYDGSANDEG